MTSLPFSTGVLVTSEPGMCHTVPSCITRDLSRRISLLAGWHALDLVLLYIQYPTDQISRGRRRFYLQEIYLFSSPTSSNGEFSICIRVPKIKRALKWLRILDLWSHIDAAWHKLLRSRGLLTVGSLIKLGSLHTIMQPLAWRIPSNLSSPLLTSHTPSTMFAIYKTDLSCFTHSKLAIIS